MPRLGLFRAEQHGVLIAGCIGRVAENLAGIVDCDGVKPVPVGISVLRLTNPLVEGKIAVPAIWPEALIAVASLPLRASKIA
jgi:hypothetical protein